MKSQRVCVVRENMVEIYSLHEMEGKKQQSGHNEIIHHMRRIGCLSACLPAWPGVGERIGFFPSFM